MSSPTLDIENHDALASYLRRRDSSCQPLSTQTLAGGVSNRTVLVRFADGREWVIKQALEKLRTKADWFSDPARVHREALGMRWLAKLSPPGTIPEFVFEDFEHHLLAMHAVPEPHENWKEMLLRGRANREHVRQFGELLGAIHRNAVNVDGLAGEFGDASFFESLRLEPYYSYTAERVPEAAEFLRQLIDETRRQRLTLVHGDYSPKNILVFQDRLVLLDHEVIHWGDPAFDVGFFMAHLLSKMHLALSRPAGMRYSIDYIAAVGQSFRHYFKAVADAPFFEGLEQRCVRHALGCSLARVAGRSPVEYLNEVENTRQRDIVVSALKSPPETLNLLHLHFLKRIGAECSPSNT